MAKIELKTLQFPGSDDIYVVPSTTIDASLSIEGASADAKAVGDALAVIDGGTW